MDRHMKENRFQRILREGGVPVGHMIMEFGTRGIAKILEAAGVDFVLIDMEQDRKSTRLNSSHLVISYAVFCLKKKKHPALLAAGTSASVCVGLRFSKQDRDRPSVDVSSRAYLVLRAGRAALPKQLHEVHRFHA